MTSNFPRLTVFHFAPLGVMGAMLVLLTCLPRVATGQTEIVYQKGLPVPAPPPEFRSRAEACAPATALRDLEWNNVRALIENGGALCTTEPSTEAHPVPKEEGVSVVYGGALGLGGISLDQQLKLAAVRYRNTGNDFWPGPLTNDGAAETDPLTCEAYDKFTVTYRPMRNGTVSTMRRLRPGRLIWNSRMDTRTLRTSTNTAHGNPGLNPDLLPGAVFGL